MINNCIFFPSFPWIHFPPWSSLCHFLIASLQTSTFHTTLSLIQPAPPAILSNKEVTFPLASIMPPKQDPEVQHRKWKTWDCEGDGGGGQDEHWIWGPKKCLVEKPPPAIGVSRQWRHVSVNCSQQDEQQRQGQEGGLIFFHTGFTTFLRKFNLTVLFLFPNQNQFNCKSTRRAYGVGVGQNILQ